MPRDAFQLFVPRTVRQLSSLGDGESENGSERFPSFFDRPAVVLLGDPGLGKTGLFHQMAEKEGGHYVTVREFLHLGLDRYRDRILYLDGLDEARTGATDADGVIGRVVGRLDELGMPTVRLSCRPADWFGGTDLSLLEKVSRTGEVVTLQLDPLSINDVQELASEKLQDSSDFVVTAKRYGLEEMLYNPLTLSLLLGIVADGQWPTSRRQVYEEGVRLLAEEHSQTHQRASTGVVPVRRILDTARFLSAVQLLAGLGGFALDRGTENTEFPFLRDLPESDGMDFNATIRRRVFTVENERAMPIHRTVAEFLGAQFLVERVRDGLPLGRPLALFQGQDGGILSDRRGVFAWYVTLAPEHAPTLIPLDPLGVALYGDPASLPGSLKLQIVEELAKLSTRDPYFRTDLWEAQPFGTLVTSETVPWLLEMVEDVQAGLHLAITALDALTFGAPLAEAGDRLLAVVRDETRSDGVRHRALRAFIHNCPEDRGRRTFLEEYGPHESADRFRPEAPRGGHA